VALVLPIKQDESMDQLAIETLKWKIEKEMEKTMFA